MILRDSEAVCFLLTDKAAISSESRARHRPWATRGNITSLRTTGCSTCSCCSTCHHPSPCTVQGQAQWIVSSWIRAQQGLPGSLFLMVHLEITDCLQICLTLIFKLLIYNLIILWMYLLLHLKTVAKVIFNLNTYNIQSK